MRSTYRLFVLLLLGLIDAVGLQAASRDFQSINQRISSSVGHVMVILGHGQERIGSGYLIDKQGTVITNAHVIRGAKAVGVRFPDGSSFQSSLVGIHETYDLAALRLQNFRAALTPLTLPQSHDYHPQTLDEILIVGAPNGLSSTAHYGTFSGSVNTAQVLDTRGKRIFATDFTVYQLNVDAARGSSGGPIVDRTGQVLGTVTAGLDEGRLGITFGIPHGLMRALPLNGPARPFSHEQSRYQLGALSDTQLSFNRSTPTELQFGQISFNFRSNQWGYVDPNFISHFLDDLPKTEQLVPANLFYQIVNRHRLLHIVNPVFRYRVVIPEIYRLDERYNQPAGIYEAHYSDPTTGTSTHIYIKQIGYLQQWELIPALHTEAVSFMRQHLGLHLVPSPYMIQSPTDVYLGPLSDAQPRLGVVPGTVKFWRQYFKHPMEDTGYFVMYGINQHLFFTVFMQYRPSQTRGMLPADFVERLFIASTVSFVNE